MKKIISAVAAVMAPVMLLCSCTPMDKSKQKQWLQQLQEAFPEDTFTSEGTPVGELGPRPGLLLVHSELYPKATIMMTVDDDNNTVSNYLAVKYADDCYSELERVFDGRFPCSSWSVSAYNQMYNANEYYPVEDIGPDAFIDNYMDYSCQLNLFYEHGDLMPTEEDMVGYMMDLIADEPHEYDIHIYLCSAEISDDRTVMDYIISYQLIMDSPSHIQNVYVRYGSATNDENHYLIEDMDL